jgi:hypothetical protein
MLARNFLALLSSWEHPERFDLSEEFTGLLAITRYTGGSRGQPSLNGTLAACGAVPSTGFGAARCLIASGIISRRTRCWVKVQIQPKSRSGTTDTGFLRSLLYFGGDEKRELACWNSLAKTP